MNQTIYFDNGSTSWPKAPGVTESMAELLTQGAFNINRGNYEGAYEVEAKVLDTRDLVARLFHMKKSRNVIFTPGITYSLNYFMRGFLKAGDHVIVSGLEHNAVMRPLFDVKNQGIGYDVAKTDEEGLLDLAHFESLIRENTKAVIVTHASNVSGTIVPIEEIGQICKAKEIVFAVDSAQSAGTLDINMEESGIDFLAFTGHKGLLGPQGIGGFLISDRLNEMMKPVIMGGTGSQSDQLEMPTTLPDKYESGTMNLPGIIGLHAALTYMEEQGIQKIHDRKMELTAYFLEKIRELQKEYRIRIVGRQDLEHRVAVVSLDFLEFDNAIIAFELEQRAGVLTRVGLHCAPVAHQSLNTFPGGTVRFAFSASNAEREIDICIVCLEEILKEMSF